VEDYYEGIVQVLPWLGPLIEAYQQKLESSPNLLQVSCFQFPSSLDAFDLPFHSFYPRPPLISPYFEQKPPFVLLQTPFEYNICCDPALNI
jgi:hypothetical protein